MSTAVEPRPVDTTTDDPPVHHLWLGKPTPGRTYKALCGQKVRARPPDVAKRYPGCPMCYDIKARMQAGWR